MRVLHRGHAFRSLAKDNDCEIRRAHSLRLNGSFVEDEAAASISVRLPDLLRALAADANMRSMDFPRASSHVWLACQSRLQW